MLANTGIKERVQEEICRFAEQHGVEKVVLLAPAPGGTITGPVILTWQSGAAALYALLWTWMRKHLRC